jgi:hypothetical protein
VTSLSLGSPDTGAEGYLLLEGVPEIEVILASLHRGHPLETTHFRTDGYHLQWDHHVAIRWVKDKVRFTEKGWEETVSAHSEEVKSDKYDPEKKCLIGFRCSGDKHNQKVFLVNYFALPFYFEKYRDYKWGVGPGDVTDYKTLMGDRIEVLFPRSAHIDLVVEESASRHLYMCHQEAFREGYWTSLWKEKRDGIRRAIPGHSR